MYIALYFVSHLCCFSPELHRQAGNLIVKCISATKIATQILLNETMGKLEYDAFRSSITVVIVFSYPVDTEAKEECVEEQLYTTFLFYILYVHKYRM